jgi:transposase
MRLMPPAYVKPYVKRQKNDATDAEAICEAVTRRHAIVALHGPRQPNVPIQPAMARPISSGESS